MLTYHKKVDKIGKISKSHKQIQKPSHIKEMTFSDYS